MENRPGQKTQAFKSFFPVDYMLIAKGNLHIGYLPLLSVFLKQTSHRVICLDFVKYDKISQSVLTVKILPNFLLNGF